MGRYNGHFASFFRGCHIVGKHRDESRNRNVTVYALPNDPGLVGIYDGVDCWVTSASVCNKSVQENLAGIATGYFTGEVELGQTRRRMLEPELPFGKAEPAYTSLYATKPRKSVRSAPVLPTPQPERRERRSAR